MNFLANLAQSAGYAMLGQREAEKVELEKQNTLQTMKMKDSQIKEAEQRVKQSQEEQTRRNQIGLEQEKLLGSLGGQANADYYSRLAAIYAKAGLTSEANTYSSLARDSIASAKEARLADAERQKALMSNVSEAAYEYSLGKSNESAASLVAAAQAAGIGNIPLVNAQNFGSWAEGMKFAGMTAKQKADEQQQRDEAAQRKAKDDADRASRERHQRTMEQLTAQGQSNLQNYREQTLALRERGETRRDKLAELSALRYSGSNKEDAKFSAGLSAAASTAMHVRTGMAGLTGVGVGALANLKDSGTVATALKALGGRTLTTDQQKMVQVNLDSMGKTLANAITSLENVPRGYTESQVKKLMQVISYQEGDSPLIQLFKMSMISAELHAILKVPKTKNPDLLKAADEIKKELDIGLHPEDIMAYMQNNDPTAINKALSTWKSVKGAGAELQKRIQEGKAKGLGSDPSAPTPSNPNLGQGSSELPPGFVIK